MEINFLLLGLIIFLIIPILVAFYNLIKFFIEYPSFYILQLVFSSFFFLLWTILAIPLYFYNDFLSFSQLILIEHVGTILGSGGALFFTFVLQNSYSNRAVLFPRFTIIGFSALIGAKLIQLSLTPDQTIYGLKVVNDELIRVSSNFSQLMIIIAFLGFCLTYLMFTLNQFSISDWILPKKLKSYLIIP